MTFAISTLASAAASLSDPAGPDPIVAAATWLQAILTGTIATSIAVIAVAAVGLMMLSGRIDWRRGMGVIAGCFLIFGAAALATGLRGALDRPASSAPVPISGADAPTNAPSFDPYAGAAPARSGDGRIPAK